MINGAANTAALVFASASFAVTTSWLGYADRVLSAEGSWDANSQAVFTSVHEHAVFGSWSASIETLFLEPHMTLAGRSNWLVESDIRLVPNGVQPAEANWSVTSSITMVPDAKQATSNWGITTFMGLEATHQKPLDATWAVVGDWDDTDDAQIYRGATQDLTVESLWWAEPEHTSGGVKTHSAYGAWEGDSSTWSTDPALEYVVAEFGLDLHGTAVFHGEPLIITGATGYWPAGSAWDAHGTRIRTVEANWLGGGDFELLANRISFDSTMQWVTQTFFTQTATQEHASKAVWGGDMAQMLFDGWVWSALESEWSVTASMAGRANIIKEVEQTMVVESAWESHGSVLHPIEGHWSGVVAMMQGAAVLSLVAAPEERQFTLSNADRDFLLSGGPRNLELSE